MFAYVQRLLLVKSRRSSSRSWNFWNIVSLSFPSIDQGQRTSQAAFHSLFQRPVVSSRIFTALSYSLLLVASWICVFSSFALFFRSSCPITMCPCAKYPLILRQSCSYRSRVYNEISVKLVIDSGRYQVDRLTLFTVCVCCILVLSKRSMPFWIIFLRSFDPPPKADRGSSSSLFICDAIAA